MALDEKELVGWVYNQVRSAAKSQADLCAAFQEKFEQDETVLVNFLVGSKYFRKTGVGETSAWMVSANRHDDLRDLLAE